MLQYLCIITPPPLKTCENVRRAEGLGSSSGQLYAFRNVSISHVNNKSDLGIVISAQRHRLDITQLKIKTYLVKMAIILARSVSHMR